MFPSLAQLPQILPRDRAEELKCVVSLPPSPAELRDGPLPAPNIPEGSHGEDGVVADSRSGYVLRLVGDQSQSQFSSRETKNDRVTQRD